MKFFRTFLVGLLLFLATAILLLYIFDYDYILRAINITYFTGHTTAYIEDYTEFENREIEAGNPQPWPLHSQYNETKATSVLNEINSELETVAFLIIKNDSIWYENYRDGYGPDSRSNSFSMAKSIVSALLGKAIFEGYIEGLDQSVADFYPQFDSRLKVGDLSSMASGLNWEENYYSPFSMTARAYFDDNIGEQILNLEVTDKPGKKFEYLSGNTQLLAMVIEKATGLPLSGYLSESLWKPLGMRNNALWQLDSEESGMEKAYCCIASNARDFAKIGKLYKDYGRWNGEQLLDSSYVATSIQSRFEEAPHYGYGFWLENYREKEIFYMRGILGQYVIVIPEDNVIIVRLGREVMEKTEGQEHSNDFYMYVDEAYRMIA